MKGPLKRSTTYLTTVALQLVTGFLINCNLNKEMKGKNSYAKKNHAKIWSINGQGSLPVHGVQHFNSYKY